MPDPAAHFVYDPGALGRALDRWFPQRGLANRRAALSAWLFDRRAAQFASSYEALDRSRLRKKRFLAGGPGDVHLTEQALSDAREICREMGRNNPLVKGLLATEADGVVGKAIQIEARSDDEAWNEAREQLWRERMVEQPCELTGRFNFPKALNLGFYSYRRDGDFFCIFTDDGPWLAEGDQCGSPLGLNIEARTFDVTNGVATEKGTGRVIGYYLGTPNRWGYIEPGAYRRYTADRVRHIFNPDRISYTRGEPALTPAIDWIDKVSRYADAELVAAHIQACFSIFIQKQSPEGGLPTPRQGNTTGDRTEAGHEPYKIEPGLIWEGEPGDDAKGIGATRPTAVFDQFILRCLMFAGRCLCMPLMHVTQDYSGATFMNARIANLIAHEKWLAEQEFVVKPWARAWYLWQTERDIAAGDLKPAPADWDRHEIFCRRWPYVDPTKEAQADKLDLENGTTSRTYICARAGRDYREVVRERVRERQIEAEEGLEEEKGADDADDV